ncbi:MAG: hypothetical protein N4A44_04725 [Alphaproteobacteria bacterium]|nr:hypothetical protein [Alphaproteobacteria bacterium]
MKTSRNILFLALFSFTFPVSISYSGVDFDEPVTETEVEEVETVDVAEVPEKTDTEAVEVNEISDDIEEVSEEDSDAMDKFFEGKSSDETANVVVEERMEVLSVEKTPIIKEKDCDDMAEEKDAAMDMALERMDQLEDELDKLANPGKIEADEEVTDAEVSKNSEVEEEVYEEVDTSKFKTVLKKYKPIFKVSRRSSMSVDASKDSKFVKDLNELKKILDEEKSSNKKVDLSSKEELINDILEPVNESYTNLLEVSKACCESSLSNEFRRDGASYSSRYDYLVNDIKGEEVQGFCMFYDMEDISKYYRSEDEERIIFNSKDGCVCKNQDYINSELEIFRKLFSVIGEDDFEVVYRYDNILGRRYDINMISHIKNLEKSLEYCY